MGLHMLTCTQTHMDTYRDVHYSFYEIKFWLFQIFNDSRQRGIRLLLVPFLCEMGELKPRSSPRRDLTAFSHKKGPPGRIRFSFHK